MTFYFMDTDYLPVNFSSMYPVPKEAELHLNISRNTYTTKNHTFTQLHKGIKNLGWSYSYPIYLLYFVMHWVEQMNLPL